MIYLIAQEQDSAPFVTFEQVAGSLEQLQELNLESNPLVVEEERLTNPDHLGFISFEYGICHVRILNGELVPALPGDIAAAQANLSRALNVQKTRTAGEVFETGTFSYEGNDFPLNSAAVMIYNAVLKKGVQNQLISTTGPVLIEAADLPKFETAMNDAIIAVNNAGLIS